MVRARIHIICGNCGCNDEWELEIDTYPDDEIEDKENTSVVLCCKNCSTLHHLEEYFPDGQS